MIKFLGQRDGKTLYGFGLSRGNCELLLSGRPIFLDLDVMGGTGPLPDHRGVCVLIGGETETAMVDELTRLGLLENTEIHRQEGLELPPPAKRLPTPTRGQMPLRGPNLVSWTIGDWCPTDDGSGPATCIALSLQVQMFKGEPPIDIVMRLKTPQAVDAMIQKLLRHKRQVWKEAP